MRWVGAREWVGGARGAARATAGVAIVAGAAESLLASDSVEEVDTTAAQGLHPPNPAARAAGVLGTRTRTHARTRTGGTQTHKMTIVQ